MAPTLQDITYTDADGVERNAHAYLVRDGNLAVPGGRYGDDTRTCAPIALALFVVMVDGTGESSVDLLDGCMSMVVNSSDEVAWTILDGRHVFERFDVDPFDLFDDEEIAHSRELYAEAYRGAEPTF